MQNKRRYQRINFSEPVVYQRGQAFSSTGSVAEDLSEAGLRLKVGEFIPINSALELKVRLPGEFKTIALTGKVVWIKEMPYTDDHWEMGLQLFPQNEESSNAIKDYIAINQFWSN